jgi:transcriptional regulator with XRE-family HTH domain
MGKEKSPLRRSEGIGSYLQQLRVNQGITTTQLAQQAGIRRATLSEWQAGKRQPRLPELEAVLDALHASESQKRMAWQWLQAPSSVLRLREKTADHWELAEVAGTAPHGGDLLRAMRLRKGWTQETVAEKMGVSQAAVVRWERGEGWLDTTSLHALCYLLGAHEEELTALMLGCFTLEEGQTELTAEDIRDQVQACHNAWFSPAEYGLTDLRLLSLMAHAWKLAKHSDAGRYWLAVIYGEYAEHLYMQHRFAESHDAANRALDIHSGLEWKDVSVDRAAVRLAEALAARGSRRGLNDAISVLKQWLTHTSQPVYKGWMLIDLARLKATQGERNEAISLGRESVRITEAVSGTFDYLHRRHDFARLLVQAGRAQEAQEFLSPHLSHPFFLLVQAETSAGMGERTTAQQLVNQIVDIMEHPAEIITQPEIVFYRPSVESLAEKLEGMGSK